ncbi:MAG: molybdopterin molybdotransferase MoeA [Candidatus Acidiferrales bacterium]
MLSYTDARQKVIDVAGAIRRPFLRETIEIEEAFGRILAVPILSDRDYPPFNRSTRDGFAVRAADVNAPGARLECVGELRAGGMFEGELKAGQCVEIMTGAGMPSGADAVVMIEHTTRDGRTIAIDREALAGDHIVPRGSEALAGSLLLAAKTRVGYAEMALAAQAGATRLEVFTRPRLAILSTGDEVVDARSTPGPLQVRNSNGISIEILARTAGAQPVQLGNAPDEKSALRAAIERGLEAGILVLSGGVSMGKYDLVEQVLADLGAKFHFLARHRSVQWRSSAFAADLSREAYDASSRERRAGPFPACPNRMGRQGSADHSIALARVWRYRCAGAGERFSGSWSGTPRNCARRMGGRPAA